MFFNSGEIDYPRELNAIANRLARNPNLNVEREIRELAQGDDALYFELVNTYTARYGTQGTTLGAREGYVYLMHAEGFFGIFDGFVGRYKIGLTNSLERRELELNRQQAPCPIKQIKAIRVSNMEATETRLHKKFAKNRKHGEYFNFYFHELPQVKFAYDREENDASTNSFAPTFTTRLMRSLGIKQKPIAAPVNRVHKAPIGNLITIAAITGVLAVCAFAGRSPETTQAPTSNDQSATVLP